MKYAKLVKLGGELIEAKDADYQDYYGILTCPECGEPVFLRKGHQRGDTVFRAAFVHHRAIREVSACEMRVGKYSQEYVARVAGEAKNQRLRMLKVSMWKYLKTSVTADLSKYHRALKSCKTDLYDKRYFQAASSVIKERQSFFDYMEELRHRGNTEAHLPFIPHDKRAEKSLTTFLDCCVERDWNFHCKIAKEALEVFLDSRLLEDVRTRLLAFFCYTPNVASVSRELAEASPCSEKWLNSFRYYLITCVVMIFITVDWLKILNINVFDSSKKECDVQGFSIMPVADSY